MIFLNRSLSEAARTASERYSVNSPSRCFHALTVWTDAPRSGVDSAREATERFGCAVLLKGAPSLVAAPDEPLLVDTQGSSDLAVAGMGDVLTGVCAGLLAQGSTPRVAGALGLYLTGRAAHLAGRGKGLMPGDVVRWLPEALRERGQGATDLALPFVLFDHDPAR